MNVDKIVALGGTTREIQGHHPFILEDVTKVWVVLSGSAAILSSSTEKGFPVGPRRSICRVAAGEVILAMRTAKEPPGRRLMVLAVEDLLLAEVPVARFQEIAQAFGDEPTTMVEAWVNKISAFMAEGLAPTGAAERLTSDARTTLDIGHVVRPERGRVAWMGVETGAARFLGEETLLLGHADHLWPVGTAAWLVICEAMTIEMQDPADADLFEQQLAGIAALHEFLFKRLDSLAQRDEEAELARLKAREAVQNRQARAAYQNMASVLDPRPVATDRESPLLGAVALVGDAMEIEIRPPPKSDSVNRRGDPLDAIARASRLRHRRVLLRGEWWRADCGPLVGYLAEDHRPVALLRESRQAYRIVDPETRSATPVNAETAALLAPEATMFYHRLPDSLVNPLQLVAFALRGRYGDLAWIISLAVAATLVGMLMPLATALVMDSAIPNADRRLLGELGLALLAAALGTAIFELAQGFVTIRMAIASDAKAQSAVWDRLLNLRVSFFARFTTGDLLSRVTAVSEVTRQLNGATIQSLMAALMSALNLLLLAYFSLRLAMIAVGLAAALAAVTIIGGHFIRKRVRDLTELTGTFFGFVVQMVNSVSKLRVAGAQRRAFSKWINGYAEQVRLTRDAQDTEDLVGVFNQAVPIISTVLLFWIGVELLMGEGGARMSIGIFLAFNTAMATFLSGATALSTTLVDVLEGITRGRRVQVILEAEREVDESKVDPGTLQGAVSLSHVDFRYNVGGRKILDDVSFRANPGEFVALVGPSGSGKSTIFRLILGFETAEGGVVAFDGKDLRGLDTIAVRRQLGVVLQSGRITSGSILDNIGAGAVITLEEAWEAAEDSGLADDIRAMPMGFHTVVSEGGTNFSGGQRQRLFIARALVTNPRILLLDEATSALDNRTQAIVSRSLERRKVTRLVVAHRLSTVRQADRIYVLGNGRVIEFGTFDELTAKKGLFSSLIARQLA